MKTQENKNNFREKNLKTPVKDNSKDYRVITNTLYWVWDKKTGQAKEECLTKKKKTS